MAARTRFVLAFLAVAVEVTILTIKPLASSRAHNAATAASGTVATYIDEIIDGGLRDYG